MVGAGVGAGSGWPSPPSWRRTDISIVVGRAVIGTWIIKYVFNYLLNII